MHRPQNSKSMKQTRKTPESTAGKGRKKPSDSLNQNWGKMIISLQLHEFVHKMTIEQGFLFVYLHDSVPYGKELPKEYKKFYSETL